MKKTPPVLLAAAAGAAPKLKSPVEGVDPPSVFAGAPKVNPDDPMAALEEAAPPLDEVAAFFVELNITNLALFVHPRLQLRTIISHHNRLSTTESFHHLSINRIIVLVDTYIKDRSQYESIPFFVLCLMGPMRFVFDWGWGFVFDWLCVCFVV